MSFRLTDLFTYALLIGVLILAFMGIHGCAAEPKPSTVWRSDERVPVPAAVVIRGEGWLCSGVAIDPHYILTAKHCTDTDGPIEVEAFPGERQPAGLVAEASDADLAWLYVARPLRVVAELAPYRPLPGTLVFAVGFGCSRGARPDVHAGAYVATDRDNDLVLAMGVCPGDSGGPLFDADGRVFGVISKRVEDPGVPVAFAAPLRGL